MLNKSLIGVFFITFIYLLAIFLKQPLEYVFNIPLLPLSLLSLILGIFFFNIFSISSNIVEGREFIKKNILQLAIVLLGNNLISNLLSCTTSMLLNSVSKRLRDSVKNNCQSNYR